MKTKNDAVTALIEAGWTLSEIKSALGNLPDWVTLVDSGPDSAWWSCLDDDQFADGTALVEEWYTWLKDGKPA